MRSFFYKALDWIRWSFGVMPRSAFKKQKVYLFLHYFAVLLCTVLLGAFSDSITPKTWDFPSQLGSLQHVFWGVVFINVYTIVRIVLYLLKLFGIEDDSEFPEIEADWIEILDALHQERLHIHELPLFIVNGLTPQQEQRIFQEAANVTWSKVAPKGNSAVVRAYIHDHPDDGAIFLCCTFVGATNMQQGKERSSSAWQPSRGFSKADTTSPFEGRRRHDVMDPVRSPNDTQRVNSPDDLAFAEDAPSDQAFADDASDATAIPEIDESPSSDQPTVSNHGVVGDFFATMTPGGLDRVMDTMQGLRVDAVAETDRSQMLEPLSKDELMMGGRRMSFLCRLIRNARSPEVPINGLLQAIPYSWEQDVDYARRLAPAIRTDIVKVHECFHLQFPVIVVTTDLDDVTGIKEFIMRGERLQPGLRNSRAGHRFAPGADVNEKNAKWVVDGGLQWIRGWVYSAFARDIDNADNRKLFTMLCEVSQHEPAMVTLLSQSLYGVVTPAPRLYGNYFWAAGKSSTRQGFVQGVLKKLIEVQGDVADTPQARQRQRRATIWGWICFLVAAILFGVSAWLAYEAGTRG